jgi:putative hydrolase of the HAD superfamily
MSFPRAVLLDLDNTVYPYEPCHEAGLLTAHHLAAALYGHWGSLSEFVKDYGRARQTVKGQVGSQAAEHSRLLYFKTMIELRCGRTDIEATRRLHQAYWDGYFSEMKPDPGCVELLHDLRGVRLAWVTDFTTERQMLKLHALGLENVADLLITSEEAGAEKPDSAIIDLALSRLQVSPEETWLIGDDLKRDVGAARSKGIKAVWFQRQTGSPTGEVPDFIVRSWFELRDLLDRERDN